MSISTLKQYSKTSFWLFSISQILVSCGSFGQGMLNGLASYSGQGYGYYMPSYNTYGTSYTRASSYSTSSNSSTAVTIKKTKKTESDGFEWYKTSQGTKQGAQDMSGKTLIPLDYDFVFYHPSDGGWFSIIEDNYNGAYTKTGECTIPISRGYSSVSKYKNEDGEYYSIKKDAKEGACDQNGNVIVAPDYESLIYSNGFKYKDSSGDWIPLGIDIRGNKIGKENTAQAAENNVQFIMKKTANATSLQDNKSKSIIMLIATDGEEKALMLFVMDNESNKEEYSIQFSSVDIASLFTDESSGSTGCLIEGGYDIVNILLGGSQQTCAYFVTDNSYSYVMVGECNSGDNFNTRTSKLKKYKLKNSLDLSELTSVIVEASKLDCIIWEAE